MAARLFNLENRPSIRLETPFYMEEVILGFLGGTFFVQMERVGAGVQGGGAMWDSSSNCGFSASFSAFDASSVNRGEEGGWRELEMFRCPEPGSWSQCRIMNKYRPFSAKLGEWVQSFPQVVLS